LRELAEVKRETMVNRLAMARDIMAHEPMGKHWLLWHDLEAERHLIEKCVPYVRTAYGSQDLEEREDIILGFSRGEFPILGTKPSVAGSGCNFQRHCADAVFLGSSYKFNDVIQAVHRIQRFQQPREVNIHFIYSESETPVVESLKKKWKQHDELVARMSALLRKFKLTLDVDMNLKRSLGCDRTEVEGKLFRAVHNDNVYELGGFAPDDGQRWPANCVDEIVTSIPFGTQYEYSPSVNDFGHNQDNTAFLSADGFPCPGIAARASPRPDGLHSRQGPDSVRQRDRQRCANG
jgi:hypothetical protein